MGRAKALKTQHADASSRMTGAHSTSAPSASTTKLKRRERAPQQASLPGLEFKKTLSFGGSLLKSSHAKTPRPLSSKQALHIVLRSDWATGPRSLLKKERLIQNMLLKSGRRHGVRVYRVANAGNHLHLLVRFTKRRGLQNFLRSSCGLIARKMLGAERGVAKKWDTYLAPGDSLNGKPSRSRRKLAATPRQSAADPRHSSNGSARTNSASTAHAPLIPRGQRFWSQRPFTRIVSWGRDFASVLSYLKLNTLEALGFLTRTFTRALPTQAIRNRVLTEMSLALGTG